MKIPPLWRMPPGAARLLLFSTITSIFATNVEAADAPVRFNRDVLPILSQSCFVCHGPDGETREADLRLDREEGIRSAFATGSLEESEAWQRIVAKDADVKMPPPDALHQLTAKQIATLKRWIEEGAKWEGHWAFIPPVRPDLPKVNGNAVSHPIDAFIEARLQSQQITPINQADPATLMRRLSLDIVGLPPSVADCDRLIADNSNEAYEAAVDRLLASPQFGERMAIFWLDLVRYADSVGYHKDSHRDVWMYRDYVIDAFNDNKPFDQFALEQLAGDLLPGSKLEQYEFKIASGFNRMNQTTSEGGAQAKEYLAKYSADRVRNTAAVFLGTTLGCAECHDHKYDPFTANDFYSFAAFFADIQERGVGYPAHTQMPTMSQIERWRALETELAAERKKLEQLTAQDEDSPSRAAETHQQIAAIEAEIAKLSNSKSWQKTIITIAGKPRPIRLLPRGNWLDDSGPVMEPAVPAFLGSLATEGQKPNRYDLAKWITSRDNPLTARVFVNRVWKLFFGEGFSRTLDDLGSQGVRPSHPELLDWLAVEFVESGWDVKHLVKLIVTSEAYQRDSNCSDELWKQDPENRLLARQAAFRLEAEVIRDNALAISGLLSPKMYGRSVKPYQPANYWYKLYKDGKYVQDHGEDLYRRGVYTYWRRSFWHPSLRAFDAPAREECVAQRPRSNTPSQSLVLLNDPTYVEAARVLAAAMVRDGGEQAEDRIAWAFRKATLRQPTAGELTSLGRLYEQQRERYANDETAAEQLIAVGEFKPPENVPATDLAAWTSVARVILNLHETITRN